MVNGEVLVAGGIVVGGLAGAVADHYADRKANEKLKHKIVNPNWSQETDSKGSFKVRSFISSIALAGASFGLFVVLEAGTFNHYTHKVQTSAAVVVDKSGQDAFVGQNGHTFNSQEDLIIRSLEPNITYDVSSQNSNIILSQTKAVHSLPLGQSNVYQGISNVESVKVQSVDVFFDSNNPIDQSLVPGIIATAKKNDQKINFFIGSNLTKSEITSVDQIASSTGGKVKELNSQTEKADQKLIDNQLNGQIYQNKAENQAEASLRLPYLLGLIITAGLFGKLVRNRKEQPLYRRRKGI